MADPCPHCGGTGQLDGGSLVAAVTLDLRLASEPNERLHHAAESARTKAQRAKTAATLHKLARSRGTYLTGPLVVRLVRLGPRELDDDNLAASAKHVRDGVADWLGRDDGDGTVRWLYAQERTAARRVGQRSVPTYGVRIEIMR